MQDWCEDPAAAPLALGVDADSFLSLGWAAPSPALSAILPQPDGAETTPCSTLRGVLEAGHAVQAQLVDRRPAEDAYDSDATIVPSGSADAEPPAVADTAQRGAATILVGSQQPPASAAASALSIAATDGLAGTPSWLPAALVTMQATAVVCTEHGDETGVIGRRVAFLLLGELRVGDDGTEHTLCEGLHVGRCTPECVPTRGSGGAHGTHAAVSQSTTHACSSTGIVDAQPRRRISP